MDKFELVFWRYFSIIVTIILIFYTILLNQSYRKGYISGQLDMAQSIIDIHKESK